MLRDPMGPLQALLLGIVEGLTEFLPVSSTGHLILVGDALGLQGESAKAFEVVIQLGAVLAVVVHYRVLLRDRVRGLFARSVESRRLLATLAVAFVPTAIAGLALRKWIKGHLFGPYPVAAALVVGGVAMIVVERVRRARGTSGLARLEDVAPRTGLWVGLGQCLSLWPGASRSMSTIVAGQLAGLSTATAAELSFLLALPTLGAATVYEGWKSRHELLAGGGGLELAIGLVTSFVVGWAVIAGFVRWLGKHGLEPFGWYRVVLGALVFFFAR